MSKIAIIAVLLCSLVVLCYLIFISFRLLRGAQQQALQEKKQQQQLRQQQAKDSKVNNQAHRKGKHK